MTSYKILVVDYGIGNVRSMHNAVLAVGGQPVLSRRLEDFKNCDALILPGVGAFAKGMENLALYELIEPLKKFAASGRPMLGVCLGMQMMLSRSFEFGETEGLNIIPGDVRMVEFERTDEIRLPHIGWTELREPESGRWRDSILDNGHNGPQSFYFVHSFAAVPMLAADTLASASNGAVEFAAAIQRDNICGTQFHPEKSGPTGLALLSRFIQFSQTS